MKGHHTLDEVRDLRYKRVVEDVESGDGSGGDGNSCTNVLECQT